MSQANILIDDTGKAVLTDFGMGVLAEATPNNYGSIHGGGAFQYRAPELHDADEFDMEDTRPTVASDMYALACVSIEVHTSLSFCIYAYSVVRLTNFLLHSSYTQTVYRSIMRLT